MQKVIVAVALSVLCSVSWAASKVVTLSVPGMDCATCPITVKKALGKVPGVVAIEVEFEKREAVVTFDDTKTSVAALTQATEAAGYPSKPVGSAK
ncbi:mercury resistance system periplasmic binding protein MerP [Pseudoduganella eburnea]|uniref:Periplasmic mercury ion-binding protein n=1 Tax=Massilia eburnea TaxID=1776165 RepID=A0A6L6QG26_9BURK|nr:mercury resistance system periplasmic binding protein MerP [Massilia eburnea]MTW10603.1 mercury resistance system periplasmic binding protein MerP [Massilia eburnea]